VVKKAAHKVVHKVAHKVELKWAVLKVVRLNFNISN
jgi:hypothetical protein